MVGIGGVALTISAVLAAIAAAFLVPTVMDILQSFQRAVQIRARLTGTNAGELWQLLLGDLCTNGFALFSLPARYLEKVGALARLIARTQAVLLTGIPGCNQRALAESLLALCALSGLLFWVLSGQILLALSGLVVPLVAVQFKTQNWIRKRKNLLREQLPDALRGLGMCFMAGLSLEQAFDQTAQECREPLRSELLRTVNDLHTGSSIRESLAALDGRLVMDEMRFVSVALEIQHRTGGSMREVLDCAADSMLASFDLSRSLEVQTSQARMSARIVSILPIALVVVLSLTMEGYLASFFTSSAGFALLLCAVGMQVAGILSIRKILGIDLG